MDIKVDQRTVIVFDLDDTLYNEMDYLRSAYTFIAKKLDPNGWQQLFSQMFSLFRSKEDVFEFVSQKYGIEKSALISTYRSHVPELKLFDGALDVIKGIKEKGGKIGIITDGRKSTQSVKLKALQIIEIVDKIVISEEVGSEKPEERNYRIIEEAFPNCSYLYMADNLRKDFISPNRLGWNSICLIDNGHNMHYDGHLYFTKDCRPKNFVTSFKEINII
ncbi:MAG: HAD family hydrolase [Aurantibacter sp.]